MDKIYGLRHKTSISVFQSHQRSRLYCTFHYGHYKRVINFIFSSWIYFFRSILSLHTTEMFTLTVPRVYMEIASNCRLYNKQYLTTTCIRSNCFSCTRITDQQPISRAMIGWQHNILTGQPIIIQRGRALRNTGRGKNITLAHIQNFLESKAREEESGLMASDKCVLPRLEWFVLKMYLLKVF